MMAGDEAKPEPPRRHRGWEWGEEARVAGAEALGTGLLVLLSCLTPSAPAFTGGLVVGMLVQCLDHVSGAMFNPTVTLAAVLWGRVSVRRAAAMVPTQLAGATLGAAALRALSPADAVGAGVTRVCSSCAPWVACCVEACGGACLALANCAAWDPRNRHLRDSWPLRIGATVAALSLVANEVSGASFNPARSFGPALMAASWHHHWVYWVGPLGGSLAATALYCAAWRPRASHLPH